MIFIGELLETIAQEVCSLAFLDHVVGGHEPSVFLTVFGVWTFAAKREREREGREKEKSLVNVIYLKSKANG